MFFVKSNHSKFDTLLPTCKRQARFSFKSIYHCPTATTRLICFAGAGSSASFFSFWKEFGGDCISLEAFQSTGQKPSNHALHLKTWQETAHEALEAIIATHDKNCQLVLFGHSYGALLAYEVAQLFQDTQIQVNQLIVTARAAPHMAPYLCLNIEEDEKLISALRNIGLDDKGILDHPVLAPIFLKKTRYDLKQNANYVHLHERTLQCSVTAISALQDPLAPPPSMENWHHITKGPFDHIQVDGHHFHLVEAPERLKNIIKSIIKVTS